MDQFSQRVKVDGHDTYPRPVDKFLGKDVVHHLSSCLTNQFSQIAVALKFKQEQKRYWQQCLPSQPKVGSDGSFLKTRLLAPLYTSFLVLVLLVVGQGCLSLLVGVLTQRATSWVTHTLLVEREGEHLLSAALEEQTGLHRDLVTKDTFLKPYMTGQTALYNSINRLYILVQDNPDQIKCLNEINNIHERWQSQLAHRVISGYVGTTLAEQTSFNSLRTQVRTLLRREEILLSDRQNWLHQLNQIKTALHVLSLVAILGGVGWNLWILHRRVEVPLRKLTDVSQAWREGQRDIRLNYSSPDEFGHLAGVLDAIAGESSHRQECYEVHNQHLEDLISALSHDLRTPLLATRTTLRPMLNGAFGPVSDTWREVLEEYRQANEELIKLVETLLDISRYEAKYFAHLNCQPLNWQKIFNRVATQIHAISQGKFDLIIKISPLLPTVRGDELEIQRVVQNLLDNAVRVSELNQQIILEVAPIEESFVQVSVRDEGPGIALQEQERLFYRFIQGRGRCGGAGLGLYLCRQIVESHGGTIDVKSTLGAGSTFWFTLPVATDTAAF